MSDATTLGRRIRAAREKLGMTQAQLADAAGMAQAVISLYERDAKKIRLDTLDRLARPLKTTAKKLLP
jgi:transcriptional regulator with XRE-family HTH domain